jgi:hypothetical protein
MLFLQLSFLDGWFVGFYTEGTVRDNAFTAQARRALYLVSRYNLANFPSYLSIFLASAALLIWRVGWRSLPFPVMAFLAALGFMLPHIAFGQEPFARYTVISSEFLLWASAWMLTVQALRVTKID